MSAPLLAVDVGNTNIVIGDCRGLRDGDDVRCDLRSGRVRRRRLSAAAPRAGIVRRMREELAGGARAACIATGGMADVLSTETTAIQAVEPDLTQGLRLIWLRGQPTA